MPNIKTKKQHLVSKKTSREGTKAREVETWKYYTALCIVLLQSLLGSAVAQAQPLNPFYQSIVANASYDTVLYNLQTFQNFGTKSLTSQALKNTASWLEHKYQTFGYTDVIRDTFNYFGTDLFNIVATRQGTLFPNKYLIICGHYDTKNGPGTNDNGSGCAIILEIARLMQPVATEYSVKYINFSGEESGFLGSQDYVNNLVIPQNMDILLVFNIDEVGGISGIANDTITCEFDNGNPSGNNLISQHYTDTLDNLTHLYSSLKTKQAAAYGSDYMPFEDNGEIITGYYESNESNYVHSSGDLLSHLDTSYVSEIARAATGAALYFAKAYDITINTGDKPVKEFQIFPNPFNDHIIINNNSNETLELKISDILGQTVTSCCLYPNKNFIDLRLAGAGIYFYSVISPAKERLKSGILIKTRKP